MIACTRVLVQGRLIKGGQRLAIQKLRHRRDILIDQTENRRQIRNESFQGGRNSLLGSLERETAKIVALQQRLRIVETTRQISGIHAREAVHGASVAANFDDVGVLHCEDGNVGYCRDGAVRIG